MGSTELTLGRRDALTFLGSGSLLPLLAPTAADASSEADVAYALADLVACRAAFDTVYRLLLSSDFEDASPLLFKPPIARFDLSITELVAGPGPDALDRLAINAIRPGVDRMVGELADALAAQDAKAGRTHAKRARAALDEILSICEAGGMLQ